MHSCGILKLLEIQRENPKSFQTEKKVTQKSRESIRPQTSSQQLQKPEDKAAMLQASEGTLHAVGSSAKGRTVQILSKCARSQKRSFSSILFQETPEDRAPPT